MVDLAPAFAAGTLPPRTAGRPRTGTCPTCGDPALLVVDGVVESHRELVVSGRISLPAGGFTPRYARRELCPGSGHPAEPRRLHVARPTE